MWLSSIRKLSPTAPRSKTLTISVGVKHVFVNGVRVLREGHTNAKPGRAWGPGKVKGSRAARLGSTSFRSIGGQLCQNSGGSLLPAPLW